MLRSGRRYSLELEPSYKAFPEECFPFSVVDIVTMFEKTPEVSRCLIDKAYKLVFDRVISIALEPIKFLLAEVERAFYLL